MNYKIECIHCGEKVSVSTRDAVKVVYKDKTVLNFGCPKCGKEIEAEYTNR